MIFFSLLLNFFTAFAKAKAKQENILVIFYKTEQKFRQKCRNIVHNHWWTLQSFPFSVICGKASCIGQAKQL